MPLIQYGVWIPCSTGWLFVLTDLLHSVPKFFRWLSERYPAISQVIAENRIPEFDCLYVRYPDNRTSVDDELIME